MMKPLLQHLFGAAAYLPFFCHCFLLYSLRTFVIVLRALANHLCRCTTSHQDGLEFSFSTTQLITVCFLVSLFLYCVAKVVRKTMRSKHFTKKVYVLSFVNTKRRKDTEIKAKYFTKA